MDYEMQQEVWNKLPLNEYQRNDMLQSLLTEVEPTQDEIDAVSDEPSQQPKKRKRQFSERCESPNHMY
jgi:hypothetical protein